MTYNNEMFRKDHYPMPKDDYEHDNCNAICPNCGNSFQIDMCDLPRNTNDGDSWDETCPECDTTFQVTLSVSTSFKSEWKKEAAAHKTETRRKSP